MNKLIEAVKNQQWRQATTILATHEINTQELTKLLEEYSACLHFINESVNYKYLRGNLILEQTPLELYLYNISQLEEKIDPSILTAYMMLGANPNRQNKDGDNALAYYLKNCHDFSKHPSLRIIAILIKFGTDIFGTNNINSPYLLANEMYGKQLASFINNTNDKMNANTQSIIKLQRAFRLQRYKAKKLSYQSLTSSLHEKLMNNPQLPLSDNHPDLLLARKWIDAHPENLQAAATQLINAMDHVSFPRFMHGLKYAINKYNNFIISLPSSKQNYILLLDPANYKSNAWVTSLALPFLLVSPKYITTWDKLASLSIEAEMSHIVLIDDAAYSGNQMSSILNNLLDIRISSPQLLSAEYSLIIPFTTKLAKNRFEKAGIKLYFQEIMPKFNSEDNSIGQTATYFAHKIATPGISTVFPIGTGKTIDRKNTIKFITYTWEPYKKDYQKWFNANVTEKEILEIEKECKENNLGKQIISL